MKNIYWTANDRPQVIIQLSLLLENNHILSDLCYLYWVIAKWLPFKVSERKKWFQVDEEKTNISAS